MSLRDILLTALLIGAIPLSAARPFAGAMFFAWVSLMNPHRMTWTFARDQSWALMLAIATLLGLVFAKDKLIQDSAWRYRLPIAYLFWMAVTTAAALDPEVSFVHFKEVAKIQLMCLVTLSLLTTRTRTIWAASVATLSVAYFGVKGGIFTLTSGGAFRVYGPEGTVIEDNNQLAVALTMTVPMIFWLAGIARRPIAKYAAAIATALIAASILGTHSRGAFLAGIAMVTFLVMKSRRKVPALALAGIGCAIALAFMPAEFWSRMETIGTYEEDASAQGRITMWRAAIAIAGDRLTGGGFDSYIAPQFQKYAESTIRAYHSIYFQALGDHGWIGLVLMLSFWLMIWRTCRTGMLAARHSENSAQDEQFFRMLQVSLIGYLVGGAFVNIGYWDYPYYLGVVALAFRRNLDDSKVMRAHVAPGGSPSGQLPASSSA